MAPDLASATKELVVEVSTLRKAVVASESQVTKLKIIMGLMALVILTVLVGSWYAWDASQDAERAITINCKNSNESRENQVILWDFVLGASDSGTPQEEIAKEKIKTWIHDLFAQRDCSDLNRKYDSPAPPDVKKLLEKSNESPK